MTTAIYARVSTKKNQTTDNQVIALQEIAKKAGWEVSKIFVDEGISGGKGRKDRPALDEMLSSITRREVNRVLVWDVSRLGRSLSDLISTMKEIQSVGCNLYLHNQNIDTSTPAGEAMFGMLSIFASFERGMIQDRVKAGLERAKKQGKKLGRPGVRPYIKKEVFDLFKSGMKQKDIAAKVGISPSKVSLLLREN